MKLIFKFYIVKISAHFCPKVSMFQFFLDNFLLFQGLKFLYTVISLNIWLNIAFAKFGGTALPICFTTSTFVPVNL